MKFAGKVLVVLVAAASVAQAKSQISGSDTMAGVLTDAIIASGMQNKVAYVGGGSGVGEKAFAAGEINITAMSRPMDATVAATVRAVGVTPVEHVVALDGVALYVNKSNNLAGLDIATLAKIFTCQITSWNQVPGSTKAGAIHAFRRNDTSGTTDTFKNLVGVKTFGACVTIVAETADIAERTSGDADAIGYAGLSGHVAGNRAVGISKSGSNFVVPVTNTIRNGSYPLARKLFIYEATGARKVNAVEKELLANLLDRSFLDPILQDHDFVTLN